MFESKKSSFRIFCNKLLKIHPSIKSYGGIHFLDKPLKFFIICLKQIRRIPMYHDTVGEKRGLAVEKIVSVSFFTLLLALLSQIRIPLPFTPVPFTLQSLGILFIGYYLGSTMGLLAVLLYLTLGTLGLPFFSGLKGGLLVLSGPTGGYLLGFLFAVLLIGKAKELGLLSSWYKSLFMGFLAHLVIYFFGVTWFLVGFNSLSFSYGLKETLWLTVIPFLPSDFFKSLLFSIFVQTSPKIRFRG